MKRDTLQNKDQQQPPRKKKWKRIKTTIYVLLGLALMIMFMAPQPPAQHAIGNKHRTIYIFEIPPVTSMQFYEIESADIQLLQKKSLMNIWVIAPSNPRNPAFLKHVMPRSNAFLARDAGYEPIMQLASPDTTIPMPPTTTKPNIIATLIGTMYMNTGHTYLNTFLARLCLGTGVCNTNFYSRAEIRNQTLNEIAKTRSSEILITYPGQTGALLDALRKHGWSLKNNNPVY